MTEKAVKITCAATVFVGYAAGVITVYFRGCSAEIEQRLRESPSFDWGRGIAAGPAFAAITVLCGVCLIGWLFVCPILFYKSYGLGYTASALLSCFGIRGMLPLALCVFPSAAGITALLLRAGNDAFSSSFSLLSRSVGGGEPLTVQLRAYALRGAVTVQCSAFVLLWDLFVSPALRTWIMPLV